MRIEFNRTGAERKELVKAVGEILGAKPKYMGMPSAAYRVCNFTVTKEGAIEADEGTDNKEMKDLITGLAERGFTAAMTASEEEDEPMGEETKTVPQNESVGLTVAVPLCKVNAGNLTNLLEAKGKLIQKALRIDATPIEIGEDRISFPWFPETPDSDTAQAYTHFITAICRMSLEQHRISNIEKQVENEKYAFRCFLLRLGFIGADSKAERKILLKNLTGSAAFRDGAKKSEVCEDELSE